MIQFIRFVNICISSKFEANALHIRYQLVLWEGCVLPQPKPRLWRQEEEIKIMAFAWNIILQHFNGFTRPRNWNSPCLTNIWFWFSCLCVCVGGGRLGMRKPKLNSDFNNYASEEFIIWIFIYSFCALLHSVGDHVSTNSICVALDFEATSPIHQASLCLPVARLPSILPEMTFSLVNFSHNMT